jgi:proline dehydrogenase
MILDQANELGVPVEVDMEQSELVDATLKVFREAADKHPETRLAMQANLRRTPTDLDAMAAIKPRIRLVKGAYAEPLDKALQSKKEVTAQFLHLTDWLFEHGSQPAFGTHDSSCIEHAEKVAASAGFGKQDFEIQMLYGIRRDLQESLAKEGYRVRVYIQPVLGDLLRGVRVLVCRRKRSSRSLPSLGSARCSCSGYGRAGTSTSQT